MTEFYRVMLYKFDDDGHGSVIAEEKLESMEPYLGLHYPESDIPQPARKLFASNWIKCVEVHGGQIVFESNVGVSTKFQVTLPLNSRVKYSQF